MEKRRNLTGGIILILLGVFFLFWQMAPENISGWFDRNFSWPFYVIGTGLIFLLLAIVTAEGGLAVPGAIIGGIGGILFYQNLTGDWVSWAYIWVLIPGLVGLGLFIGSLISKDMRHERRTGLNMFMISFIITLFLWAVFHFGMTGSSTVWAVALIVLGGYLLITSLLRKK